MAPLDREVVMAKLRAVSEYLAHLEAVVDEDLDAYRADYFRQRGIEKTLINAVQASVDVNNYILAKGFKRVPIDQRDSFLKLGEVGVLPAELARAMAPAAGLRNRLVHEYEDLDDEKVLEGIKAAKEQFPSYVAHVREFLDRSC